MKSTPCKTIQEFSLTTTDHSSKNKTRITHPTAKTSCCSKHPPIAPSKTPHCIACPTPNSSSIAWRIYTPESGNLRMNRKKITITPPCVLKKEYYMEKKANVVQDRALFNKKKLRGRLFHCLQNNFIMDKTSYHLMTINTKENAAERGNFKETKHGNEYRKKHQIGIVTKKTSDAFNNIIITRRYEDNHYTPQEFVKKNFTSNEILLFQNDPVYFNLGSTPINHSNVCFTKHLKERLNSEEDSRQSTNSTVLLEKMKNKTKLRPYSTAQDVRQQKGKLTLKVNHRKGNDPPKDVEPSHFHPIDFDLFISKLQTQNEALIQKQSLYLERKSELEDIKSIKIERSKETRIKRRNKQLQIADKLKKEDNAITTLVNMLKHNYHENNYNYIHSNTNKQR